MDEQDDLCNKLIRDTHYNKGNSHFLLNEFDKAYESFSHSGVSSRTLLGRGNSKLKLGEYLEALENYDKGKGLAPKRSAVSCYKNALLANKLIQADCSNPMTNGAEIGFYLKNLRLFDLYVRQNLIFQ